jgi:hypothetical protein
LKFHFCKKYNFLKLFSWNGGNFLELDPLPGFPEYEFLDQWCAELDPVTNKYLSHEEVGRNVSCGIAGPVYNNKIRGPQSIFIDEFNENKIVWSFEYGSEMYRGKIVRTYKKGQTIDATINVILNHF